MQQYISPYYISYENGGNRSIFLNSKHLHVHVHVAHTLLECTVKVNFTMYIHAHVNIYMYNAIDCFSLCVINEGLQWHA